MTKYYLHGGNSSVNSEDNKQFFQQLVQGFEKTVNFLCVYFAKDREINKNWNWDNLFDEDIKQISLFCPITNFDFILASENIEKFSDQVKNADIIFFKGGITPSLLKKLKEISDIEILFQNKTIAGSSA
jgi:peptidase E